MDQWPIGVFTSVDAGLGVRLDVARELSIPTVHLHAPSRQMRTRQTADEFLQRCREAGITVTVVFTGFEGDSYASIAETQRTVGLVPEETRAARLQEMKEVSDFAALLGCDTVALHMGFIPEDRSGESYAGLVGTTRELLDHIRGNGQQLNLETGQETAEQLLDFISDVDRSNLFVNFDPANMILYGVGEPNEALRKVGHLVHSVHVKDAKWAEPGRRGVDFGEEVPLGEGDVGIETYLRTLKDLGYTGPLTIEREIAHDPERQKADIGQAVELLRELRQTILG